MVKSSAIRNVVLVGSQGNGKTSIAEALLYHAGVVSRLGSIEATSTLMDADPLEQARHQSLALSVASFGWNDHKINLIDTPGYPDFSGEVSLAMSVADVAVLVIDGVAGVQPHDAVLWRRAGDRHLPRMIFVNKLDRERSSFDRTLAQVQEAFGSHADPVELPIGEQSGFHGVADLLTDHALVYDSGRAEEVPVPTDLRASAAAAHTHLVEEVVDTDDELLEHYLDGHEPSRPQLEHQLHEAMDAALLFPVLCGSATTPISVDQLGDLICKLGPAPGELGPTSVIAGPEEITVEFDPGGRPLAFVFKTVFDEFLGQLSMFKVLSGTIRPDDVLVNPRTGARERLHQLIAPVGAGHEPILEVPAGDIAAVTKLVDTRTGDTLAPDDSPVMVAGPHLSQAVHGVGIEAKSRSDEDRLATTLRRLVLEDPTLSVDFDQSTRQTVLRGAGDTHLQVALARIARGGIEVVTDEVRIAYRETLAGPAEVEGKYKKQTGGHGQFGVATVRFEPLPRDSGFEFVSEVSGGAIPKNLVPAVGAGIEESMARGGLHGFPVVDIRAVCSDGRHHSVDSSEMSFKMAGSLALRAALEQAGVEILEPMSAVVVTVPSDLQGDVLGDLNGRRAHVLGTDPSEAHDMTSIRAHVPTAELRSYAVDLQSMTSGLGSYVMDHHGYKVMPPKQRVRFENEQAPS